MIKNIFCFDFFSFCANVNLLKSEANPLNRVVLPGNKSNNKNDQQNRTGTRKTAPLMKSSSMLVYYAGSQQTFNIGIGKDLSKQSCTTGRHLQGITNEPNKNIE